MEGLSFWQKKCFEIGLCTMLSLTWLLLQVLQYRCNLCVVLVYSFFNFCSLCLDYFHHDKIWDQSVSWCPSVVENDAITKDNINYMPVQKTVLKKLTWKSLVFLWLLPRREAGDSDVCLLSGISGLSLDSPFLSPLFFFFSALSSCSFCLVIFLLILIVHSLDFFFSPENSNIFR